MKSSEDARQMEQVGSVEALPDLNPCREVGWIFRDGGCIAIERLGDEIRSRVSAD